MIRIAWYAAIILFTLMILLLLWQFSVAIVMFALSLSVAAAMRPTIDSLSQRGIPRSLALIGTYIILVIVILGIIFIAGEGVVTDIQTGVDRLLLLYERALSNQSGGSILGNFSTRLPSTEALYEIITEEQVSLVLGSVFGFAEGAAQAIGNIAIVLVLSVYWSVDQVRFERLWFSLLPVNYRYSAREIWREIELGVGAYIRRQFTESLLAGVILWFGYTLMGIEMASFLAVIAAFLLLIPWVGIALALIPAFLIGLMSGGLGGAIAALVFTLIVLLVVDLLIAPRLFTHKRYSSLLLMVLIVTLTESFGLIGAVLAPPLAVSIQIFLGNMARLYQPSHITVSEVEISNLEKRVSEVRESMADSPEPLPPEVSSLAERLEQLLGKTHQYIQPSK
jgi:predicted PurR-regulated permease PerM